MLISYGQDKLTHNVVRYNKAKYFPVHVDGIVQAYSIHSALAMGDIAVVH